MALSWYILGAHFSISTHKKELQATSLHISRSHFMPCCLATRCAVLRPLRTLEATHVSAQRCRFVSFPQPLLRQLLSTISGSMPRGRLFSEDAILAAFEKAEGIRFPIQEIQAIMPEVVQHCSLIADALSVPVSWVLLAELCTSAFLAPTSALCSENTPIVHHTLGVDFTPWGDADEWPDEHLQ